MKRHIKRTAILVLACVCLLLGLAGLVLPILQGVLFLAVSLVLFPILSPTIGTWAETHTRKYPKVHAVVKRVEDWLRRVIGEV
ncbi:MAG: hypothetical protein QG621_393 [Patescibacteria group bacterium]|nr:hypothetical protein [Patescibacteria group bacterium]